MSFYVTLHNKETNFETIIDPPMVNLNNYEVALFDIKFTSDFLVDLGTITICTSTNYQLTINITSRDNVHIFYFLYILNLQLTHAILIDIQKKLYKSSVEFDSFKQNIRTKIIKPVKYFKIQDNTLWLDCSLGYSIKEVKGKLKNIFYPNIEKITNNTKLKIQVSFLLPKRIQILNSIFVHTNIIESQYCGNKKSNILRLLNVKYKKDQRIIINKGKKYIDVKNSIINSINIELLDDLSNILVSDDFFSQVLMVLHFRLKK
jgi:hypothetical protein